VISFSFSTLPPAASKDLNMYIDEKSISQNRSVSPSETVSQEDDGSSSTEHGLNPPPPYLQPIPPSNSVLPSETIPTHARTNHLEVRERRRTVRGSWEIDTSLVIPPSLLKKWSLKEGPRPNLNLVGRSGGIVGEIFLSGPSEESAIIRTVSRRGPIKLKVVRTDWFSTPSLHSKHFRIHSTTKRDREHRYLASLVGEAFQSISLLSFKDTLE
jgi:hypothetical protein